MKVYQNQPEMWIEQESLWESLELSHIPHAILSIVGGGGKTSVMYQLAGELSSMGKKVIVTTSTHIFCPEEYPVLFVEDERALEEIPARMEAGVLVAGGKIVKKSAKQGAAWDKMDGPGEMIIRRLTDYCDVLLIEADGARRLPVKLPADHEPVILPETDVVIGCVGLDCIGEAWTKACFRWELAEGWLRESCEGERICPEDVARILTDERGTRKGVGKRPYRIVLNKADDEQRRLLAKMVLKELKTAGDDLAVVTSFAGQ